MQKNKSLYHLRMTHGIKTGGKGKTAVFKTNYYLTSGNYKGVLNGEIYTRKASAITGAIRLFNAHAMTIVGSKPYDPKYADDRFRFCDNFVTDHTLKP